jgi:hypothetical protein
MSIQVEEPGVWVAYCDMCGERKVLDAEADETRKTAEAELEEADWEILKPEAGSTFDSGTQKMRKILHFDHHCSDCK